MASEKQESRARRRGVVASPELVALLEERLRDRWRAVSADGKLTRDKRAELLGLSPRTADKLMAPARVDRASMITAMKNVGIDGHDDLIQYDPEGPCASEDGFVPTNKESVRKFPRLAWVAVAAAACATLMIAARTIPGAGAPAGAQWKAEFHETLKRGTVRYQTGAYELAAADFLHTERLARTHGDTACLAEALRMQGDVLAARGDLDGAESRFREALRLRKLMKARVELPAIHQTLGVLATRQRKFASAKQFLLDALTGFAELKETTGVALVQRDLGALCSAQGQHHDALAWFVSARSALNRDFNLDIFADLQGCEAMALHALGRHSEARPLLEDCLSHWQQKKHPRWIASTELKLGKVELALGNADRARELFRRSAVGYASVGDKSGQSTANLQYTALQSTAR